MKGLPASGSENHLKFLDSARGIASLMVFFSHFIALNYQDKMNVHYFFFLFNGNDAVSFFFVLSGFVLSYKYIVLGKPLDIKQFYVARFFRLFPAYFLTIILMALITHRQELSLQTLCNVFVFDKTDFWEEALLLRFHNKYYYPGWTLTLEMAGSFLVPFFVVLAIKNKKIIPYLIVVTLIVGNNLLFSYLFLFGFIASCNYENIISDSFEQTRWFRYRYPIVITAILLFSLRQIDAVSPFGPDYKTLASYLGLDFFTYSGPACFVFLVAILHSKRTQRILENKILVFLGKISYSIYLVHLVVTDVIYIYAIKYLEAHKYHFGNFMIIALITTTCIILFATVVHYTVELPFMRIGKRITRSMKPSLVVGRGVD